jgi:transposase-like protein
MLKEEKTVGQLAAEYGVHPHLLYRWRDQVLAGLPSLFSDKAALEFAQQALDYRTPAEVYFAI